MSAQEAGTCIIHAAVTNAALDSRMKSVAEWNVREKIPAEVFHTTKNFVLVCRSDLAFKLLEDSWQRRSKKTERFPQ